MLYLKYNKLYISKPNNAVANARCRLTTIGCNVVITVSIPRKTWKDKKIKLIIEINKQRFGTLFSFQDKNTKLIIEEVTINAHNLWKNSIKM